MNCTLIFNVCTMHVPAFSFYTRVFANIHLVTFLVLAWLGLADSWQKKTDWNYCRKLCEIDRRISFYQIGPKLIKTNILFFIKPNSNKLKRNKICMRVSPLTRKHIYILCCKIVFTLFSPCSSFELFFQQSFDQFQSTNCLRFVDDENLFDDNKSNWSVHLEIRLQTNSLTNELGLSFSGPLQMIFHATACVLSTVAVH